MKTAYTLLGALFLATAPWNGMLQAAPNATTPGQPTTANPTPSAPGQRVNPPPTYYYNQVPVYTNQAPRSPDIPRQSSPMQ